MKPDRPINVHTPDGLRNHLDRVNKVLTNISHGTTMSNSDPSNNIDNWKATGTTPNAPNTEFSITHGMARVPLTLGGWDTNNGGTLYRSSTAWTKTQVFLKCTTANAVYNLILI